MKLKITCFILIFITSLSYSQTALVDTFFSGGSKIDSTNTTSVDYLTLPGKLKLQTGENENLARNKYSYLVYKSYKVPDDTGRRNGNKLIDGGYATYIEILPLVKGPGGEGSYIVIDLQAIRTVNRVKMWTLGFYPGSTNTSVSLIRPRAYTIYGGLDTVSMDKLVQVPENLLGGTDDFFAQPVNIRFLKITIDVLDQNNSTVIGEIEVFGKGYLPEGFYTSSVRDIGQAVNWGSITWDADIPAGTQLSFRLRTGNSKTVDSTWSKWSDSVLTQNSLLEVFEPRRYAQYQIRLGTNSIQTPLIRSVSFNYDKKLIASSSKATVSPQFTPILEQNTFTYTIDFTKNTGEYGIDSLLLYTPSPSDLISLKLNGTSILYNAKITPEKILIAFANTINSSGKLELSLRLTPFSGISRFVSFLISKESPENPQRVDVTNTAGYESWSIVTTGVPKKLIIAPKVEPNPFTPNGDGVNDETSISFFLSNINVAKKLTIKLFDLNGRLIKEIENRNTISAAYVSGNSFKWNGRDDYGKVVKPGLYIIQIYIDSDNGGEQVAKTVTIAY